MFFVLTLAHILNPTDEVLDMGLVFSCSKPNHHAF
jgi:hypothetical protein